VSRLIRDLTQIQTWFEAIMRNPDPAPSPVAQMRVDDLTVLVYEDRARMGRAAALAVIETIQGLIRDNGEARVVFAAAPSQDEFLAALGASPDVDWSSVVAFHMDEYLGIAASHPASFRRYLREHLHDRVGLSPERVHEIAGESEAGPETVCRAYEKLLAAKPPQLVCAGIGENGHLAFNDPPVADFDDPARVKVVALEEACRAQQVHDGCFARIEDVPTHAYTLTVPALMAAATLSVVVPGPRKADAVRATLRGPIAESCPASVLRRHAGARLYLDTDSARLVL
jgi:glucosamine-6-phosphate deaminase